MIPLIQAALTIIILILQRWFKYKDDKKVEQDAKIKELRDAIKTGDTSTITATLSGLC
jgi:hypothetical protein